MNNGLKMLRAELGLTQETLAKELNQSFCTINCWENGRINPQQDACEQILEYAKSKHVSGICIEALEEGFSFARSRKKEDTVRIHGAQSIDKELICLLTEESDTAIYVVDDETYNVVYMKKATEKLLKTDREHALGK